MRKRNHQPSDMTRMPRAAMASIRGSSTTRKQRKISVQGNSRRNEIPVAGSRPSAMRTPRSGSGGGLWLEADIFEERADYTASRGGGNQLRKWRKRSASALRFRRRVVAVRSEEQPEADVEAVDHAEPLRVDRRVRCREVEADRFTHVLR